MLHKLGLCDYENIIKAFFAEIFFANEVLAIVTTFSYTHESSAQRLLFLCYVLRDFCSLGHAIVE